MLDAIENPINERWCLLGAIFFGDLDSFVDGNIGRNIGEEAQLIDRQAEDIPLHQPNPLQGPVGAAFLDEGIDLVPEREILLRCDPRALAQACADLIADDARASAVGTAARERVRELYARDAVVQRMAAILAGDTAVRTGAGVR